MDFLAIIEKTATGFSAYALDLPGCIATGRTQDEVLIRMREAVEYHIEGSRLEGFPMPEPTLEAVYFNLSAKGSVGGVNRNEILYGI